MRILLADDQSRVRFALRALLSKHPGIEIVGEAVDAQELLDQAQTLCPDLVLMDWSLPGLPQVDLLRRLRQACPSAVIIVLSGRLEARPASLQAGADAFVSKVDPPARLLEAINDFCRVRTKIE